jgi:ATP-dependent DNA ligase
VFDAQLRSRFDWLREPDPEAVASPPVFMTFDLLYRDGRDYVNVHCATVGLSWKPPWRAPT